MKFVNNTKKILQKYDVDKKSFFKDVQSIGLSGINSETPVKSGNLKSGNKAEIQRDAVIFFNTVSYFIFVHGGTLHQSANPFMFRGLMKSRSDFVTALVNNLKV